MLRKFVIFIAVIALVFPVAFAHADSLDDVFCGDLSQSDCQILQDNAAVMDSLNSFAVSMSMNLEADSEEPMRLSVQANGQFELDDESLQAINERALNLAEAEWAELAEIFLTSAKAVVWMEITDFSGAEGVTSEFNLLLKDGILMLSADALSALSGEDMSGMEGFGIDLNDAIGELLAESGAMPEPDSAEMEELEAVADSAMSIMRLADSEVMGTAVAVFRTDFDLNAFLALVSADQLVAASNDMDDAKAVGELMDAIEEVGEFSLTQYVGLDDKFTYGVDMLVDMSMSYTENGQQQNASISFDLGATLSDFGEPVDVAIPEDVFVFPLAMMMQMGS